MQQQQSGGMMSGLLGTVVQGMAFGTGSAIAHRAVGAAAEAMSGDSGGGGGAAAAPAARGAAANPAPDEESPCRFQFQQFQKCLDTNEGNISACQMFYDAMSQCQRDEQHAKQYA